MSYFNYRENILYCEDVPLSIIAEHYGTPCYIYSRAALEANAEAYITGLAHTKARICYAVKANSNIAILNLFAKKQLGFDIVSGGELERVLAAHGDPKKIIFSGVGKQTQEITRAIKVGVGCFDVESAAELERLNQIAKKEHTVVSIALRVNPNIDALTHPHISTGLNENKFGIFLADILSLAKKIQRMPNVKLTGLAFHIGSQLTDLTPLLTAIDELFAVANQLTAEGMPLKHLNFGGGLGVSYKDEVPPSIQDFLTAICKKVGNSPYEIILEPGRSLVANAGILLTRIEYIKTTPHKNFIIIDAAMNDLIRPVLYDAWHDILPVNNNITTPMMYDVVGPVCETADFIARDRYLGVKEDGLLAILTAGAYGFCMSSNYNSRARVAEVMVDQSKIHLIRERESIKELFDSEHLV